MPRAVPAITRIRRPSRRVVLGRGREVVAQPRQRRARGEGRVAAHQLIGERRAPARPARGAAARRARRRGAAAGRTAACRAGCRRRAGAGRPPRSRSRRTSRGPPPAGSRATSSDASESEDAEGPMRSAADPAAELVELRQAEALGILDQHHAGIRHVDPDLDHRRRHQHVQLARPRRRPSSRRARRRVCCPWTRPMRSCGRAVAQPLDLRLGARRRSAPRSPTTSGTTTNDWRPAAASEARNASIFGRAERSRTSVRIG